MSIEREFVLTLAGRDTTGMAYSVSGFVIAQDITAVGRDVERVQPMNGHDTIVCG